MDTDLANLLKSKKAAVLAGKDTSVIDANIAKIKKAKYSAATTPEQINKVEGNEEMADESEDEELTAKQKKIAAAAAPRNKITGADFKALKAHKENTDITNFLKAVTQKNYAQANKYLQGAVETKIKKSINTALNK